MLELKYKGEVGEALLIQMVRTMPVPFYAITMSCTLPGVLRI